MRIDSYPTTTVIRSILYILSFTAITLFLYYIPNYFLLEWFTAQSSAVVLNLVGIPSKAHVIEGGAFVNEVQIVRECTGIQVIAVFAGLLLPFPKVLWKRKIQALALIVLAVYIANIIRIVLELWLLYNGILPWSLAHEPLGTILGVISVAIFFLAVDHFIPQVGDYIFNALYFIKNKVTRAHTTK